MLLTFQNNFFCREGVYSFPSLFQNNFWGVFFLKICGGGSITLPTHPLSKKSQSTPPPQISILIFFFFLSLFLHFSLSFFVSMWWGGGGLNPLVNLSSLKNHNLKICTRVPPSPYTIRGGGL